MDDDTAGGHVGLRLLHSGVLTYHRRISAENLNPSLADALDRHARLSRWVAILLWASAAVSLALLPLGVWGIYDNLHLPVDHDPENDLLPSELVSGCVALVFLPGQLTLLVLFLRWIYKSNQLLNEFGRETLRFSPGWAVGWYFVPFANLVKPYQSMKEMWRASHGDEQPGEDLLGLWWFLWICSNVLGQIVLRTALRRDPSSTLGWLPWVELTESAVDLALALVALTLVRRLGTALRRTLQSAGQALPSESP